MRKRQVLLVAASVILVGMLAACGGAGDTSVNGNDKTAFEPDSVRGDTTFYSYPVRAPEEWHFLVRQGNTGRTSFMTVTPQGANGQGAWLYPGACENNMDITKPSYGAIVGNSFILTCVKSGSAAEDEETVARALELIEAASATVSFRLRPDSAAPLSFYVAHPAADYGEILPAGAAMLQFVGLFDQHPDVFRFVRPHSPGCPL